MSHILGWYLTALVCPFFFWALLAMLAGRRPRVLPRLYPWLTALCWVLWISVVVLMLGNLLSWPSNKVYLKLSILAVPVSSGFMLVRNWLGRRVHPEAYSKKLDGWWPSPKR